MSWVAEKSSRDLVPMLKNAYSALKEKERDLVLAAEIGKSLLENNMALKSSYETLLQQTQRPNPLPTPSSSLATHASCHLTLDNGSESGDSLAEDDPFYNYPVPSHSTREAMIEVLEKKNVELNQELDVLLNEQTKLERTNIKRTRQLESEVALLRSNLEIASSKVLELEEMNERQKRIEKTRYPSESEMAAQDDHVEQLLTKVDDLQFENAIVIQSKQEIEKKLSETLKDLRALKDQYESYQSTEKEHQSLQEAYRRQFQHISELNATVEDHRHVLQRLQDKGIQINTAKSTPAPSCYGGDTPAFRNTLLGELESEWLKSNHAPPALSRSASTPTPRCHDSFNDDLADYSPRPTFSTKSQPAMSYGNLSSFCQPDPGFLLETALSKVSGIDPYLLDQALEFVNRIEEEHDAEKQAALYEPCDTDSTCSTFRGYPSPSLSYPLIPRESTSLVPHKPKGGRVSRLLGAIFRSLWRWCRFAIILTTAILISLWGGPDGVLED
ncbi:hypothetical protein CLU79DRAFT_722801 [Phycomyces nitens]|nr:hypothetical protein CLU79DRAFT_722801 [Phycomyces nitens]